jgi:hypothetical protein
MTSLRSRLAGIFVEPPPSAPAARSQPVFLPPTAASRAGVPPAPAGPARSPSPAPPPPPGVGSAAAMSRHPAAAVLGTPAAVVPMAAACAGELRARTGTAAALLCVWRPAPPPATDEAEGSAPPAQSPAGATTPGARRLAARLTVHDLPATACGRLAWLALDPDPVPAASRVGRCIALAEAPVVLAIAGPRPAAFEPLLAGFDVALAVLAPDVDPALRDLALATLGARERAVVAPLAPGPPRWAAMAGLARLRSLPREAP